MLLTAITAKSAKAVLLAMMLKVSAYSGVTLDRQETLCLAHNIYWEARGENVDGQTAVAYVTLNRARTANKSICAIVKEPNQFSWVSRHNSRRQPSDQDSWESAVEIAALTQVGFINNPVGSATHYHASAARPYWAKSAQRIAVIDNHIFYERPNGRYQ